MKPPNLTEWAGSWAFRALPIILMSTPTPRVVRQSIPRPRRGGRGFSSPAPPTRIGADNPERGTGRPVLGTELPFRPPQNNRTMSKNSVRCIVYYILAKKIARAAERKSSNRPTLAILPAARKLQLSSSLFPRTMRIPSQIATPSNTTNSIMLTMVFKARSSRMA
jgi:hypothetical protein